MAQSKAVLHNRNGCNGVAYNRPGFGLAIMGTAKFARQSLAAAGMCAVAGLTPAFSADAPVRRDRALSDRVALFAGGDIARQSYFVWAGIVGSPFGLLHEDGFRLRAVAGGGRYRYHAPAVPGGRNEGTIASGEFMLGFHRNFGAGNITIYLGGHVEDQRLAAPDPGHDAQGMAAGVKAALEFYHRLGADFFWTASASASTVHRAYHARAAVGASTATSPTASRRQCMAMPVTSNRAPACSRNRAMGEQPFNSQGEFSAIPRTAPAPTRRCRSTRRTSPAR
jgi:hypothetical protein